MRILHSLLYVLIFGGILFSQNDQKVLRFPSINSDGSKISFSFQGDIWVVPVTGGQANRLTIHEGYEHSPRWSPNDESIVFSSNRYGNDDLFTIRADGSNLNRLTYHSAADNGASWINNDQILFSTRRNFVQVEREREYYQISAFGGTPFRSMDVLGLEGAYSNDGKLMAFVRGTCRASREAYTGPANRNIWIYNGTEYIRLTDFEGQDTAPNWGSDHSLYYLSAKNGRYNIHRQELGEDGKPIGTAIPITSYKDEGIEYFDVSADGTTIVYNYGGDIYTMSNNGGTSKKLTAILTDDYRFDPTEYITYSKGASELSLSPDESKLAMIIRGEVFVKENNEKRLLSVSPAGHTSHEKDVQWLNDSTLLFLSDRDGDFDLYSVQPKEGDDVYESFEWTTEQITNSVSEEDYYQVSPDKSQIAIVTIDGMLSMIDIDTIGVLSAPRTVMTGWAVPQDISWSPDSRWIAYSYYDLDFNEEIFIRKSDGSGVATNVSMHPRGDSHPIWSRDGSKLGFISIRNNGDADIWFAWLKKDDWERTSSDWDDIEESEDKENDEKNFEIDIEGIHERLVQVTRIPGNESDLLISDDGEEFFFTTNSAGRAGNLAKAEFKKVKWNGEEMETILSNGNISRLSLDKKGKYIYYINRGGGISKVPVDSKKSTSLPFKAKMHVDHIAEKKQIFDEAWRTLRDRFYDPQFHGKDWDALREHYESRALATSTNQDFIFVFNQMLGQLNASHMGLRGQGDEDTQKINTGLLGLELKPHPEGVEITRIVPNSSADKAQSKLIEGEIITAVNGKTTVNENFYSLINETVDERIRLTVSGQDSRNVVIRPGGSTRTLLYEEWVNDRRKLIDEYSEGRLGYIHIRGMNWSSFERFERELMASGYGKEGLVIDVRYNGGGWTTDMVMAVLNVRQHSYTVPRGATDDLKSNQKTFTNHYPYGERLPLTSWTKPSIALCNQNSYSNAEIFSHAYKTLGIGSLVGQPTFGAVISTGGRRLMDGFFVRVPFRAWYVKATQENMEHGPAVPDYIIENDPDSRFKNEDAQLKKAVEVLLSQID